MRRAPHSPTLIEVRGEQFYNWDSANFSSLFIRRATALDINPAPLSPGNTVKKAKQTDVEKLLEKHFGGAWMQDERLSFFIDIVSNAVDDTGEENEEDVDEPCEVRPEFEELIV